MNEEPIVEQISLPLVASPVPGEAKLMVLGAFKFEDGGSVLVLPGGSQRLLGFLALRDRTVTRAATAGALWPESSEAHAHAALRSALSRLEEIPKRALDISSVDLALRPQLHLDIRDARALAHRLLIHGNAPTAEDTTAAAVLALSSEILPDSYDDWAVLEAEDWRQLRLHALEALANHLTHDRRFADAAAAALAAVRTEPLRETANATLIHVHLAEGNPSEAHAAFNRYRVLLEAELGLDPGPLLRQLLTDMQNPTPGRA